MPALKQPAWRHVGGLPKLTGHDRDRASDARRPAEAPVGGEQITVQRFGESDITGVVGREVVSEFPDPIE